MTPEHIQLREGSVLVRSGTLTPRSVPLSLRTYCSEWQLIQNSIGHVLDRDFRRSGWNLFFLAGAFRGYAIGSGSERSVLRATVSILANMSAQGFNCAQITEIAVRRFLGVRYIRVEAHSRHLQQSNTLEPLNQRVQAISATAWSVS